MTKEDKQKEALKQISIIEGDENLEGVLEKVVVGWGKLESNLISCCALGYPALLIGMHGNAKTTVAKIIGKSFDSNHSEGCEKFENKPTSEI